VTHLLPPPHRRVLKLAGLITALAAIFVALAVPATAMASPCGDKVLADWFDNGRIDRLYDLHCYEEAIDAIPSDLRDYANAEEVISRALQAAVNGELDPIGGPDPSPDDVPRDPGGGAGNGDDPDDPDGDPGGGGEAAPDVDTSGISSVPIPLIVLALMSVALLTAGGLGYLRRRHAAAGPDESPEDPQDLL
jgi:hypothetical protein